MHLVLLSVSWGDILSTKCWNVFNLNFNLWYLSSSILAQLHKYASHLNSCWERTKGWGLIFNSVDSPHYISPSYLFIAVCSLQENCFTFVIVGPKMNRNIFSSNFEHNVLNSNLCINSYTAPVVAQLTLWHWICIIRRRPLI